MRTGTTESQLEDHLKSMERNLQATASKGLGFEEDKYLEWQENSTEWEGAKGDEKSQGKENGRLEGTQIINSQIEGSRGRPSYAGEQMNQMDKTWKEGVMDIEDCSHLKDLIRSQLQEMDPNVFLVGVRQPMELGKINKGTWKKLGKGEKKREYRIVSRIKKTWKEVG